MGFRLSITRDSQPRLWSTIGLLLILVVKRNPIPNSLCLQLGTVPCYAIWSRFERPFWASPIGILYTFVIFLLFFPISSSFVRPPVPHRTEILFSKLAAIKTEGESRRNGEFTIHNPHRRFDSRLSFVPKGVRMVHITGGISLYRYRLAL